MTRILVIDLGIGSRPYHHMTKQEAALRVKANPARFAMPLTAKSKLLEQADSEEKKEKLEILFNAFESYNQAILDGGTPTTQEVDDLLNGKTKQKEEPKAVVIEAEKEEVIDEKPKEEIVKKTRKTKKK